MGRVVICMGILNVKRLLKLAEFIIRERVSIQCLCAPKVPLSYSNPHGILLIILQHSALSANIAERDGDISFVNFWGPNRRLQCYKLAVWPRCTVRTCNSSRPATVGAPYGPGGHLSVLEIKTSLRPGQYLNLNPSTIEEGCGPGSIVGIATGYGLDGPGIEWWAG